MREKLSALDQALIDAINKTSKVTGEIYDGAKSVTLSTIEAVKEQAPEVVQQLLMFKFIEAVVYAVLCGLAIILWLFLMKKAHAMKDNDDGKIPAIIFGWGLGGAFSALMVITLIQNTIIAIKISVAPKLYLLEYAAQLLGVK